MRAASALVVLLAAVLLAGAAPVVRRAPAAPPDAATDPADGGVLCVPGDGSVDGCVPAPPPPPPLPPGMSGVFHLKRAVELDALNLELKDTGWRWTLCGCDVSRDRKGPVLVDGKKVVLQPPPGKAGFPWMGTGEPVESIELTLSKDGTLKAVGKEGPTPFEQKLGKGRICAVCNLADFPSFKPPPPEPGDEFILLAGPRGLVACEGAVPTNPCDPR